MTGDVAKTRTYFEQLLGWSYTDTTIPGGTYPKMNIAGEEFGGIASLNSPMLPKGTPPHIAAMATKVTQLKGQVLAAPFDVMEYGRMATIQDPTGAVCHLWQNKKHHGMTVDRQKAGAPSWFELMTTNTDAAGTFYTNLFGWTAKPMTLGNMTYWTWSLGTESVGGMMAITPEMGKGIPSHWGTYFTVTSCDATVTKAKTLGTTVTVPPTDIPGIGRFAGLATPEGLHFLVISYN
jgi:predicted enzyme related to lactoylglutathione lyase